MMPALEGFTNCTDGVVRRDKPGHDGVYDDHPALDIALVGGWGRDQPRSATSATIGRAAQNATTRRLQLGAQPNPRAGCTLCRSPRLVWRGGIEK